MTNKEKGLKLIEEARRIFDRDLSLSFEQKDFNLTVRRAQEVVELATKGALQILGVDYPKVHDVGLLLVQQAQIKKCTVDETSLSKIAADSLWLASIRNIAFYGEGNYPEPDAAQAFEAARFSLQKIESHFKG